MPLCISHTGKCTDWKYASGGVGTSYATITLTKGLGVFITPENPFCFLPTQALLLMVAMANNIDLFPLLKLHRNGVI